MRHDLFLGGYSASSSSIVSLAQQLISHYGATKTGATGGTAGATATAAATTAATKAVIQCPCKHISIAFVGSSASDVHSTLNLKCKSLVAPDGWIITRTGYTVNHIQASLKFGRAMQKKRGRLERFGRTRTVISHSRSEATRLRKEVIASASYEVIENGTSLYTYDNNLVRMSSLRELRINAQ